VDKAAQADAKAFGELALVEVRLNGEKIPTGGPWDVSRPYRLAKLNVR
jgi:hypothetical protein